jgi:hypothetical protein
MSLGDEVYTTFELPNFQCVIFFRAGLMDKTIFREASLLDGHKTFSIF